MKQLVQDLRSGETSILEVPVPKPASGAALVLTAASLVSAGTERMLVEFASKSLAGKARSRPDLVRQTLDKARREGLLTTVEAVRNRLDQPLSLGYSSAGTILEIGEGVSDFKVGDRVACAGGGFAVHAEYAVVPKNLMAPLPDQVPFEAGAFATLGAIAMHGFRLADSQIGERVVVIGLGLLGILAAQIARAAGCRVFGVDLDPERVAFAEQFDVTAVHREDAVEAAASVTGGQGFDSVLICADTASSDPINLAAEIARDRARVVVIGNVGMDIPRNVYYGKELDILVSRSYGPGRYDPFYEEQGQDYPIGYVRWTEGRNLSAVIDLLASGQLNVDSMITHRFPIDQGKDAYDLITGGTGEPFLAVILTYPEAEEEIGEPLRRVAFSDRPIKPESVVRVGVLGAGNFANNVMLPAMRQVDGIEFLGIASAGGLSGSQVAERFGFRYTTTEEVKLLEDENVNTIAVLTRHNLHVRQTIAALRAGKHVFCEKPLALNTADLNEILEVLEQSNRLLMVGFNRRFASLSQSLKAFMKRAHEPLVMAYRINAGYLPSSHWLHDPDQGGGRIVGEACHFIDLLTFFVDSLPVRVNCIGLPDGNRYHEDNVIIVIEFADGSIGTVTYLANGDRSLAKERIEVFGGGRAAVLDDFRTLELYSGGKRRVERSRLRQDKGHRGEWGAFAEAVTTGGPPPIPYDQLIAVTQASFAAIESLTTQRVVLLENFLKD